MAFFVGHGPTFGYENNIDPNSAQEDDPALDFNMANLQEDIVNAMFCTYEPPMSTKAQSKAAKKAQKHPERYRLRPRVPKSILKFKTNKKVIKKKTNKNKKKKNNANNEDYDVHYVSDGEQSTMTTTTNKKSVTWRDHHRQQEHNNNRTKFENDVVSCVGSDCGGIHHRGGEGIADILSSPTGRAAQSCYFGNNNISNATTSRRPPGATPKSALSTKSRSSTPKHVLYDDLGNVISEDDIEDYDYDDNDNGLFQPGGVPLTPASVANDFYEYSSTAASSAASTAAAATAAAAAATVAAAASVPPCPRFTPSSTAKGCEPGLFCANVPYLDNMMEAMGIAAIAAGMKKNVCANVPCMYNDHGPSSSSSRRASNLSDPSNEIVANLKDADRALGIMYEPEYYGPQPGRDDDDNDGGGGGSSTPPIKLKRQATPKHINRSTRNRMRHTAMQNLDCNLSEEDIDEKASTPYSTGGGSTKVASRSDVNSDLTMGDTTVKHFDGKSLLDDGSNNIPATPKSGGGGGKFRSMVNELKHAQPLKGRKSLLNDGVQVTRKGGGGGGGFRSMVDELKHVQRLKGLRSPAKNKNTSRSSPYSGNEHDGYNFESRRNFTIKEKKKEEIRAADVKTIKSQLNKNMKHGRGHGGKSSSVITESYLKSINNTQEKKTNVPSNPIIDACQSKGVVANFLKSINNTRPNSVAPKRKENRLDDEALDTCRSSGRVPVIKEKLETRDSTPRNRDPCESDLYCRNIDILPPTPNNKKNGSSSFASSVRDKFESGTFTPRTFATDVELREEVSMVGGNDEDEGVIERPVMRHSSLEIIPRTVDENDINDDYLDSFEQRMDESGGRIEDDDNNRKSKNSGGNRNRKSSKKKNNRSSKTSQKDQQDKSFGKALKKSFSKFGRAAKKGVKTVEGTRIQENHQAADQRKATNSDNEQRMDPPNEISFS